MVWNEWSSEKIQMMLGFLAALAASWAQATRTMSIRMIMIQGCEVVERIVLGGELGVFGPGFLRFVFQIGLPIHPRSRQPNSSTWMITTFGWFGFAAASEMLSVTSIHAALAIIKIDLFMSHALPPLSDWLFSSFLLACLVSSKLMKLSVDLSVSDCTFTENDLTGTGLAVVDYSLDSTAGDSTSRMK